MAKHRKHYGIESPPTFPDPQSKGKTKKMNPIVAALLEEKQTWETYYELRENYKDQTLPIAKGRDRVQVCPECGEPFQQDKGRMARKTFFAEPEYYCVKCIKRLNMTPEDPMPYPYRNKKK